MSAKWWRGAVIYQIYPRSFMDANSDGVGDLPGITERLPYVASLGVDAVWLSPFFPSPMRDFGYDVADYCDVDPLFGTLGDARRLVERAHTLGLRVIIDQVWSHSSDAHPWFEDTRNGGPRADWYVRAEPRTDGGPPNNWLAAFGGPAWTWDGRRGLYYLHNFLSCQPDLNVRHPEVQQALLDVGRFWLDVGVDGFRFDVANFFTHDPALADNPPRPRPPGTAPCFRQWHRHNVSQPDTLPFVERVRALADGHGDRLTLAEIVDDDEVARMAEHTAPGRFHTAYSFTFLRAPITPERVRAEVEGFFAAGPESWACWAFSNHDVMRVATREGPTDPAGRAALARTLGALLLTLPGTLCLYQGEELGLTQVEVPRDRLVDPEGVANWPRHRNRDGARTPMPWGAKGPDHGFGSAEPWLPFGADHGALSVAAQEADPGSTLAHFRRLLAWRRARPELRAGAIQFLHAEGRGLAFERGRGLLCAFNLGPEPLALDLPRGRLDLPPWTAALDGFDAPAAEAAG